MAKQNDWTWKEIFEKKNEYNDGISLKISLATNTFYPNNSTSKKSLMFHYILYLNKIDNNIGDI